MENNETNNTAVAESTDITYGANTLPATEQSEVAEFLTLKELERSHILAAIELANGSKPKAAKMLGITVKTVYNKLNGYNGKTTKVDVVEEKTKMFV